MRERPITSPSVGDGTGRFKKNSSPDKKMSSTVNTDQNFT